MKNSYQTNRSHRMRQIGCLSVISALIAIWALVACSPIQTPVAIATSTIIPSTATNTPTPVTPTAIPPASSTPVIFTTQSSASPIRTILETNVELDVPFTEEIIGALATELGIRGNRIQVVSVEADRWDQESLGCEITPSVLEIRDMEGLNDNRQVEGLRYVLLVGTTLYEYHTQGTETFQRCAGQERLSGEILLTVDPLASEIFVVVQNLLASELDLSSRRVQLVDILPVTWSDTSLGCPQPDQNYTELEIQGYHIVVSVGNDIYIYHSDSNTAYPCPLEQSIIPAN